MNLKEYQELCKTTAKKFDNKTVEIMTYGLGIAGEAGDVAGCIKKTFAHKDDVTLAIKENLGDTMWYISMICNYYDWNLEDVLKENIDKLTKRFPEGFKHGTIRKRIDWNERQGNQV